MHHHPSDTGQRTLIIQAIACVLGYLMTVAGGCLGYYIHALLFTMMPVGTVVFVATCWRLTRV